MTAMARHVAPTEQVRHAAAEQQQAAEAEQIRAEHPLGAADGEREGPLDRWQGLNHDLRVENNHEVCRAQQRRRLPTRWIGSGERRTPSVY